jgi:AbrB family looped-hinge helix DNA binding protein
MAITLDRATKQLTGEALLKKVKELSHLPRREIARQCRYFSQGKDGQNRVNLTDFYDALLAAKGVPLTKDSRDRGPTFRVSVHKNGQIVIGSTYTELMGLQPGDEFEIKLGHKHIHLKQIESDTSGDSTESDNVDTNSTEKLFISIRGKVQYFEDLTTPTTEEWGEI